MAEKLYVPVLFINLPTGNITFLTSIPLYWGYYAYRIFKNSNNFNKNTIMFYNVIKGTFSGLKLGFSGKSNIEWL